MIQADTAPLPALLSMASSYVPALEGTIYKGCVHNPCQVILFKDGHIKLILDTISHAISFYRPGLHIYVGQSLSCHDKHVFFFSYFTSVQAGGTMHASCMLYRQLLLAAV